MICEMLPTSGNKSLKTIPNLELRIIPFHRMTGGIVHAKYLLVDGKQAFVGRQNLDWRALEQIQMSLANSPL